MKAPGILAAFPNLWKRATILNAAVQDEFFADGYCDCRCGPIHHRIWLDDRTDIARCFCFYHHRECGKVTADKLRAFTEEMFASRCEA